MDKTDEPNICIDNANVTDEILDNTFADSNNNLVNTIDDVKSRSNEVNEKGDTNTCSLHNTTYQHKKIKIDDKDPFFLHISTLCHISSHVNYPDTMLGVLTNMIVIL